MRTRALVAGMAVALAAAGCASTTTPDAASTTEPGDKATVSVTAPSTVKGNVVELDLASTGVSIVKADGDTSGKTAHYHIFIDEKPMDAGVLIGKGRHIVHTAEAKPKIYGLTAGKHTFTVVLGDGTHSRILPAATDSVTVQVDGPSVQGTVPAAIAPDQPFNLDVKVAGLTLIKADGDVSGATGHLHIFIDKEPTPAGQPIPAGDPAIIHSAETQIPIPALAAGEHTLWIVAGDGAHTPLKNPVVDKITVTVGGAAGATGASPHGSMGASGSAAPH